jgi:predicted permease
MQVGVVSVVLTTLLAFAAGWAVLTLAARRSRQWVRVVMAAAAVIAVVSTAGPLSTALDAATGVLLAAMHLITGAAFLAAAATVRAR